MDCAYCPDQISPDDEDAYREVVSWVNGPKLDGPVLREQTGRRAHKKCIEMLIAGQSPEQESLF